MFIKYIACLDAVSTLKITIANSNVQDLIAHVKI